MDHFVLPVDQGRDLLAVPTEPPLLAMRTRLQVKAQARGVGLALDLCCESAPALPRLHRPDWLIGRPDSPASGPSGCRCAQQASRCASAWPPRASRIRRNHTACAGERRPACERACRNGECCEQPGLGRVSLHASETLHRLSQQGIVELAGAFKVRLQPGRLLRVHLQGQGENKRGRWLVSHAPST
jgi:hypothetical protein